MVWEKMGVYGLHEGKKGFRPEKERSKGAAKSILCGGKDPL